MTEFEKHVLHTRSLGWGISCEACLRFLIFLVVTCSLMFDYGVLLDLLVYGPDPWGSVLMH